MNIEKRIDAFLYIGSLAVVSFVTWMVTELNQRMSVPQVVLAVFGVTAMLGLFLVYIAMMLDAHFNKEN